MPVTGPPTLPASEPKTAPTRAGSYSAPLIMGLLKITFCAVRVESPSFWATASRFEAPWAASLNLPESTSAFFRRRTSPGTDLGEPGHNVTFVQVEQRRYLTQFRVEGPADHFPRLSQTGHKEIDGADVFRYPGNQAGLLGGFLKRKVSANGTGKGVRLRIHRPGCRLARLQRLIDHGYFNGAGCIALLIDLQ